MPADSPVPALVATIQSIRRCFWLLKNVSDAMITDLGVTASQRAVLEHLSEHGASTVPAMAAVKAVKRQSIQELVDSLLAKKLIVAIDNPAHRRSAKYELNRAGRALFDTIQKRELSALKGLASRFEAPEMARAAATLARLQEQLRSLQPSGAPDD